MKKGFILLLLTSIFLLFFANVNFSAKIILKNLCEMDDIEVTWSGTWSQRGTDGYDNPGTNLVDGDYYNKWGSYDIRASQEEWVQITFAKEEVIDSFCIYQESSGAYTNIRQYTLQILNEEEEWEIVYTSPLFDEFWIEDEAEFDEPITTSTIRFHCTNEQAAPGSQTPGGQCAVELSEIELFQKVEIEDTPEPTSTPEPTEAPKSSDADKTTDKPVEIDKKGNNILVFAVVVIAALILIAAIVFAIIKIKKNKTK